MTIEKKLVASLRKEVALIKDVDAYTWGLYQGKPLSIETKTGIFALKKGDRFGARLSSNGKLLRFVKEERGVSKVYTVDADQAKYIYKHSKLLEGDASELAPVGDSKAEAKARKVFDTVSDSLRSGRVDGKVVLMISYLADVFADYATDRLNKPGMFESIAKKLPFSTARPYVIGKLHPDVVKVIFATCYREWNQLIKDFDRDQLQSYPDQVIASIWALLYCASNVSRGFWNEAYDYMEESDFIELPRKISIFIEKKYDEERERRWND